MDLNKNFILAAAAAILACAACARADDRLDALHRISGETESKIQEQVLDRMLGPGKASVFLETEVVVRSVAEEQRKDGVGELHREKSKINPMEAAALMDKEEEKEGDWNKEQSATQKQMSRQEKKAAETKDVLTLTFGAMKVRILHDTALSSDKLKTVKEVLLAVYAGKLKAEDITFVPAAFAPAP